MATIPNEHTVHPRRRLGRRPPSRKPALRLVEFLKAAPSHPTAGDHFSKVHDWGMYTNDRFGVCGPTSVANSRKLTTLYLTGKEESPALNDVYDLYRRSGNPGFDPATDADDNGVDMQQMLEAVVAGGIGDTKALGFASVDTSNLPLVDAAIDIFGFLLYGVDLKIPQQSQTDQGLWDYVKGNEWGGHAILGGRYAEQQTASLERRACVTWAEVVDMTDSFISNQMEEAWVVIWPEHLDNPAFHEGFDLHAFADAYVSITGRPFPANIPPQPAPAPTPTPTPTPAPTHAQLNITISDPDLIFRINRASKSAGVDAWAEHHFKSYFK
jgi:hypothetical protein